MDWGIIYQSTLFLAIAMLATVVTIFVFASSLLGRAIETASQEQKKLREEQEESYNQRIKEAQEELKKAEKTGDPQKAQKALTDLIEEKRRFEKKSKTIEKSYLVFTTRGGVAYPGFLFLLSLILSGVAWGFSGGSWQWLTFYLWGAALLAMGWGGHRLYSSLKKIEEVAVTSEEAALKREAEAFSVALTEHEEKRKPKLGLKFTDEKPPFHIRKEAEMTITFELLLIQGEIARKPIVWLFAPPSFDFPNRHTWLQPEDGTTTGGYITTEFEFEDRRRGMAPQRRLTIKAPSDEGSFSLGYRLTCEDFDSGLEKFEVIVE